MTAWNVCCLIVLALALAGCRSDAETGPGSALLITLDTTRFDALGCNGSETAVTPNLDRLARESIVFERAYTVAPLTLPAHASMLTGLYPPRHSVRTNGRGRLPSAAKTLAEAARDAGVQTAAFVSAVVLDPTYGLDQGFEVYDAPGHDAERTTSFFSERAAVETVAGARAWLERRDRSRPFLLWVHLWEPHAPLEPPAAFRGATPEPYLDEVSAMDHALGALLDGLRAERALDETTVLVVADHGEAFGEKGELSHGVYCHETTLRVPMILRLPGGRAGGTRSDAVASVADVAPTLARGLGGAVVAALVPQELDGAALGPESSVADERGVYFESYYGYLNYDWSPIAGWIDAAGKYVHSSRPQLFDPRADPLESLDLAQVRDAELLRYQAELREVGRRPALEPEQRSTAPGAGASTLRKLGYAAVDVSSTRLPPPSAPSTLPSPMDRVEENQKIVLAVALVNEGEYARAEALYAAILEENPLNYEALERIGFCQLRQLRTRDALASYERAVAAGRASASALTYLGVCLRAANREAEALELYAQALALDPTELEALWQMIDLLEHLDRGSEAEPLRERLRGLEGEEAGGR